LILIIVAFLTHNGYLEMLAVNDMSLDTMIVLTVAVVLLVPRLRGGARWRGGKE